MITSHELPDVGGPREAPEGHGGRISKAAPVALDTPGLSAGRGGAAAVDLASCFGGRAAAAAASGLLCRGRGCVEAAVPTLLWRRLAQ